MQPTSSSVLRVALLALALAVPAGSWGQGRFDFATTRTLLPKAVLPEMARLALTLDPARDTFDGHIELDLRASEPVPAIVLHARGLTAGSAELQALPVGRHGATRSLRVSDDPARQMWRLQPQDGQPVAAGRWRLRITYQGTVQRRDDGLFRVNYRAEGRQEQMLATQLEAVSARSVMPAFDEPVFRYPIALQVVAPAALEVISNMPRVRRTPVAGGMRHVFAPTPAMPCYLLSVAVGRFDVLTDRSEGIPLRIFTAPGKREQARAAMEATKQVLPYYARFFGRPYALPKLDQIAVPGVRTGAMEDWGLISYIEDVALYDPRRSDPETLRRLFGIIAHEIAHQWFGNLVSVSGWDEIWLNEAFATWMQRKASAALHPEWNTPMDVLRWIAIPKARDATPATRAIRSGAVDEASVASVFDDITYDKGGAVLSMLEQWIGEVPFQRGLAAYMAERAFKPATAADLWHHIGRAANRPAGEVAAVAASWTDQPGLPVVEAGARCDDGKTLLTLRQRRFSLGEPLPDATWRIPLRITRGSASVTALLDGPQATIALPGCDDQPVLLNPGGRGYFHTALDETLQALATKHLASLRPEDQVTLLIDGFALANAGTQPMARHLALSLQAGRLPPSQRTAALATLVGQWEGLDVALEGTPAQDALRTLAHRLFGVELDRLGWQPRPGEDRATRRLRADLIHLLANLRHAPTLARAGALFDAALADADEVDPSLRAVVLEAAAVRATDAQFSRLLDALRTAPSQERRWQLLDAAAASTSPGHAQQLLDESLSGRLPPDVSVEIPNHVAAAGPASRELAYRFALAHWDALLGQANDNPFGGRHWILPRIASRSADAADAERLLADQLRMDGAAGSAPAQTMAAKIRHRAALRSREAGPLRDALARLAQD